MGKNIKEGIKMQEKLLDKYGMAVISILDQDRNETIRESILPKSMCLQMNNNIYDEREFSEITKDAFVDDILAIDKDDEAFLADNQNLLEKYRITIQVS